MLTSKFSLPKTLGEYSPDDFFEIDNTTSTENTDSELDVIIDENLEHIDDNSTKYFKLKKSLQRRPYCT